MNLKHRNSFYSIVRLLCLCLVGAVIFSCSQTRFVPQERFLLDKVELEIDDQDINKEEAKALVRQKENYKILGFMRFYLMIYNMSSKKKTDDWLKRIGEAPQLYDQIMVDRSVKQLRQYLNYRGYYRADIKQEVRLSEKKHKAHVKFKIKANERYKLNEVEYNFSDPELAEIFHESKLPKAFRSGKPFDYYELEKQQKNIVELYRNHGYYYFSKNQVRFEADTSVYEKQANLTLFVGETREVQLDSTKILRPYRLNNFYFSVMAGNSPVTTGANDYRTFSDTLQWDNSYMYQSKQVKYPPELFDRSNQMKSGDLYRQSEVKNTFDAFNRLRQFRFVDIQFEEAYPKQDSNLLDCNIRLAPLDKQSTSFDIEGTNTSGNLGIAGNIYYQHRNLFRGAEVFQLRLKGATERLNRKIQGKQQTFNTRELGVESNLIIPKLLGPGRYIKSFDRNLPKTVLNVGYNYQRRPEYTRTISNLKMGYDWKTSEKVRQQWNFIDMNFVELSQFDEDFISSIRDLYIKSSFTDHFIFASNYSFIYSNQRLGLKDNYSYARFNIESAGNTLWLLSSLTGQKKYSPTEESDLTPAEYFQFLNTQYAQYLKADLEVRKAVQLDKYNSLVGRAFIGVGLPYGNSRVLPFEKQYFSGGANGIRAWRVRSLGPGSYKAKEEDYPNQSSDIKLEANFEYRFRLLGSLEGALFLDAGNIWAINKYDNREGAQFRFDRFYKQIAIGTGTGFRFDLSYFVLRVDLGMKLRDPAALPGERWIIGNRSIKGDDFAFSFAIGYPF